jgi:large subunit ribosomal protein L21
MEQISTHDKYAIFARGHKQYQAVEGKTLAIDRIEGEPGAKIEFKEVLFRKAGDNNFEIGQPFVKGAVKAVIVKQMKGPKKLALRFKRRKKVSVQKNSRASMTVIRFESI